VLTRGVGDAGTRICDYAGPSSGQALSGRLGVDGAGGSRGVACGPAGAECEGSDGHPDGEGQAGSSAKLWDTMISFQPGPSLLACGGRRPRAAVAQGGHESSVGRAGCGWVEAR
jgi:hypothetical protein